MFALDDQRLSVGVRRVIDEQVTLAIAEVRGQTSDSRDDEVHAARKRCKRLRAVVRLLRGRLGDDLYRRENAAIRDAARELSAVRDAQVLIETLDAVVAGSQGHVDAAALDPARLALQDDLAANRSAIDDDAASAASAVAALEAVARRSRAWPLHELRFDDLRPGARRVYRVGRERMRAALAEPSAERFHDWRKRVKDLWHHTELLAPSWPRVLGPLADELHTLSGLLGDDHDRAVLADRLTDEPGLVDDAALRRAVLATLDEQQEDLRAAARALGARVYAEPPDRYVDRLAAYWHAGPLADPMR